MFNLQYRLTVIHDTVNQLHAHVRYTFRIPKLLLRKIQKIYSIQFYCVKQDSTRKNSINATFNSWNLEYSERLVTNVISECQGL